MIRSDVDVVASLKVVIEADTDTFLTAPEDGEAYPDNPGDQQGWLEVRTFAEAGVLCGNPGLVIRLPDGSEFQVQVVRSG